MTGRDPSATAGRQLRDRQGGLGLTLRVVGDGVFATYPLPASGEVVLGRSEKADVVIEEASISRRHAILRIGPPLTVEDLGSANGTRIGERRLSPGEAVPIAAGDVVDLGSVMLVVQPGSIGNRPRRLWAHGYFEGRLDDECARAQRSGQPFAVVRVHVEGLAAPVVEETLGSGLRAMDMIASYGPGEYELLLLEVTPELGRRVVDELSARLSEQGATVDVGSAFYPRDGRTGETLIAHACSELRDGGATPADDAPLVVEDPRVQQLHRIIDRVARSDVSVVLLGEPGVGKATVAELIHRRSARGARPLLRLDCGACSAERLARQLFGDPEGDGATKGLLERALGSTLFLHEVAELPAAIQERLLRAIELSSSSGQRPEKRSGADRPTLVPGRGDRPAASSAPSQPAERPTIRFIAASNRELDTEVLRGRFHRDLSAELSGITLLVPPLRERAAEIEPLARAFIDRAARRRGAPPPMLADEALALLQRYGWPGNIRELQNVIERAVSLCDSGTITLEHLPVEKLVATLASRALASWASPQEEPTVVGAPEIDGLTAGAPLAEPESPSRRAPAPATPRRNRKKKP